MAKVMTDESNYSAIAGAIRSKLGVSTRYKPSEMSAAIGSISGVSSADNGKVVVDGQLTQQTSRSVSQNGTYDTTTNNEVVVNVSGGGGGGSSIDLNVIANFTPNVQTNSVKSGGFSIAPLVDITIDKLLIFPNSATSVNAYIEDSNGNSVASVTGASVTARTWSEVPLQNPIKLKEDETYVIWYDEGGQLLYAVSGNQSPNLGSLASVTSLYATSIAKPTAHESARYGINAHASYIGG